MPKKTQEESKSRFMVALGYWREYFTWILNLLTNYADNHQYGDEMEGGTEEKKLTRKRYLRSGSSLPY